MRVLLLNPRWDYAGSIYFGCREPHLPLELGYARALLEEDGHEVALLDAHAEGLDLAAMVARVALFAPELVVITTAPTYLFWRCPPPELRVPKQAIAALRAGSYRIVAVGPHGSTTPETTLQKLGADAVVLGECEEVVRALGARAPADWGTLPSVALPGGTGIGARAAADMAALPALVWRRDELIRHAHHHHRFDVPPDGLGAELEASRGCPFSCTFCAKETHRDKYRKRPLATVLAELDGLIAEGVSYVYWIDEIFLPNDALVEALAERRVRFGVQTRIDLWSLPQLTRLGEAGCVSIEAGIESISEAGRAALDKRCKLDTPALTERLVHARKTVPFVQATLMDSLFDDRAQVEAWRKDLVDGGVWVNDPVPLFAYPGSPDYRLRWGDPDGTAWERAHDDYVDRFPKMSDIQNEHVVRLRILEDETR